MNQTREHYWIISDEASQSRALDAIQERYALEQGQTNRRREQILDSFAWDIWHSGAVLSRAGRQLSLIRSDGTTLLQTGEDTARFWWELPDGQLRAQLRDLLEYSSFNPVAKIASRTQALNLRNPDGKIVVRGQLLQATEEHNRVDYLKLMPMRGYAAEFERAAALLSNSLGESRQHLDLRQVLLDQGIQPRTVNRKPGFGLSPDEAAEAAVRRMALTMSRHARIYESGILADIDTEFVHQYRVSLRKTRSLITLSKNLFEPSRYRSLKSLAGDLVRTTGPVRDLDVFLLERTRYAAMLPPDFSQGVEALFNTIARDRARAQSKLTRRLRSKAHEHDFKRLFSLLEAPPEQPGKAARRPITQTARHKILKHFHKLIQLGATIGPHTPDDDVHELRIEGKKLRYLIEFFQELFNKTELKPLQLELRKLQDVLGQFNDFSVQQSFLMQYARAHASDADLVTAVGGLTALLHQEQLRVRAEVQDAFGRFGCSENVAAFERIFTPEDLSGGCP